MSNLNLVISVALLTSTPLVRIATPQNIKEWDMPRLMPPTFPEIKSIVAYNTISCYSYSDEETINSALNKYSERIQFISFGNCDKGDK